MREVQFPVLTHQVLKMLLRMEPTTLSPPEKNILVLFRIILMKKPEY
jgi:hypothetical protein